LLQGFNEGRRFLRHLRSVNYQVAGQAVGGPRSLDLDNFERVQALLRFNMLF
jgi:hypothetical protein